MTPTILLLAAAGHAADLLPGDDAIAPAAGEQFDPHLVEGDGSSWLLVWQDTRASLADTLGHPLPHDGADIWATRVDETGMPIDVVPFPVASTPWKEANPRAAWSAGQWLVAFDAVNETPGWYSQGVYAARVDASGALLDPAAIVIDDDASLDEAAYDVAGDGGRWAVLWQDVDANAFVLDAALVEPDGTTSAPMRVHTPVSNSDAPWNGRLAWNVDRYLVVWEQLAGADWDVKGRLLDDALAPLGNPFSIGSGASNDVLAAVAPGADDFYVAWREGDYGVSGTPVSLDGAVTAPGGVALEGGLFPIDPHPDVAWSGSAWGTAWENWSWPAGSSMYLTWAEPDGMALAPESVGGPESLVTQPSVAAVDGGVLVSWLGNVEGYGGAPVSQDIHTRVLLEDGTVGPLDVATLAAPAQTRPELAAGADGFLLVAQSQTALDSRILAWRLDSAGVVLDAEPIVLSEGDAAMQDPDVAWNGSEYLVVWEDSVSARILGRRVAPDGAVLDASPIAISDGVDPAVAASGADFLVVSSWSWTPEQRLVVGRRVASDGTLIDAKKFQIGANHAEQPDVVGHAGGWTVGWHRRFTHDSPYTEARVNTVSAAGVAGKEILLQAYEATADHTGVTLAHDGTSTLAVWSEDGDLQGRFVGAGGALYGPVNGMTVAKAANAQFDAALAWDGSRYVVGWTDWRIHPVLEAGEGDVYATSVTSRGKVASLAGFAIAADAERPEGNAAVASLNGGTLYAWTKLHDGAPYASFRIETLFVK